jgi:hypothetical protein
LRIALIVKWAGAVKTLVLYLIIGAVGYWIYKRYGADARDRFTVWFNASGAARSARDVIARVSRHDTHVAS